ncbi:hypothetical protein UFOVP213_21 [uncultured Caudovirales phage]|uniref:Uncharacterized protein n=1 Tax=uncultured Caudovirales phage TaxID=2100421 RepID=A0A6J7WNP7_9CAUD|nr:hypothetical protein UFOVP213_21 [uncultured Caudovirales phage]
MKEVVITLLVAILIFFIFKNAHYTKDEPYILTKIDTVYQEKTLTKYTKGKNIPYSVISEVIRIDTITDTIKILNDYLSVKVYTDTFTIDSSKFTIIDTISQNTIQGRRFLADIKERTITITNDIYHKDKNSLYLGFLGDLRRFDNKLGIGVGLTFKTAKNDLFNFGATTNQFSVGYYKKLF